MATTPVRLPPAVTSNYIPAQPSTTAISRVTDDPILVIEDEPVRGAPQPGVGARNIAIYFPASATALTAAPLVVPRPSGYSVVMPKYLVTGGAGFIGSHIVAALVERGESVRVLDNLSSGRLANIDHVREARIRRGRSIEPQRCGASGRRHRSVFHQAALASVPRSVAKPLDTNAACVTGTVNLLDAARLAGVRRVVYAGSSSAYGDRTAAAAKHETDLPAPVSPYAAAKVAGELYCQAFHATYGLETVSFATSTCSARGKIRKANTRP